MSRISELVSQGFVVQFFDHLGRTCVKLSQLDERGRSFHVQEELDAKGSNLEDALTFMEHKIKNIKSQYVEEK